MTPNELIENTRLSFTHFRPHDVILFRQAFLKKSIQYQMETFYTPQSHALVIAEQSYKRNLKSLFRIIKNESA